jgi:Uma2 family endonuclease
MPMLAARVWTPEDLDQLPETGERVEVLDGVLLVTAQPAALHQRVATRLASYLVQYCDTYELASIYAPGEVRWRQNVLAPDVLVSPIPTDGDAAWRDLAVPLLVVEVHSPSTHLRDRGMKRLAYEQLGVPEYWQVDLTGRSVLVTLRGCDDVVVTTVLEWQPDPVFPALRIELAALFR